MVDPLKLINEELIENLIAAIFLQYSCKIAASNFTHQAVVTESFISSVLSGLLLYCFNQVAILQHDFYVAIYLQYSCKIAVSSFNAPDRRD
ncbi:hypothetical protein CHX87_005096 [Salmonella enterica subsp. enterica serovar Minnesota]|nr:hypothetical protein [Salmonella enterica subsp. enterica serovar Minnesota]